MALVAGESKDCSFSDVVTACIDNLPNGNRILICPAPPLPPPHEGGGGVLPL